MYIRMPAHAHTQGERMQKVKKMSAISQVAFELYHTL